MRGRGRYEQDDDLLNLCENLDFDYYHDNWLSLACSGGSNIIAGLPELAAQEEFDAPVWD